MQAQKIYTFFKNAFSEFHPSLPTKKEILEDTSDKFFNCFLKFTDNLNETIDKIVKTESTAITEFYNHKLKQQKEKTEFYSICTWVFGIISFILYIVVIALLTA